MDYELEHHNMPDHGTIYFKAHNKTLKGHLRGMTRGLVTGLIYGSLVGLGFFLLSPLVLGASASVGIIASVAALGALIGGELMGHIGTSAGTVSAMLAEKELRLRYPSLPAISPDSPQPGVGYHSEIPPDRDKGKIFHWRTGLMGAVLGGLVGYLFGVGELAGHLIGENTFKVLEHGLSEILGHGASHLSHQAIATGVSTTAAATFGAQFGINRGIFKSVFNFTDNLFEGRIGGPSQEQVEKDRARWRMEHPSMPSEVTSLQRQEEFYRLQNGYYKEAFKAGFAGNARGLIAGMVIGSLSGLAFGALISLGLGIAGIAAPGFIITMAMATGAGVASRVFAKNTAEPALHAGVDEVYEERIEALKAGKDIGFSKADQIAAERRQADPEMNSPEAETNDRWINPKVALIGAVAGVLVGAVLSPVTGLLVLGMAKTGLAVTVATKLAASCTALGLLGSVFGFGGKVSKAINNISDFIYLGTLSPEKHPDVRTTAVPPLMESNSPLLKRSHGVSPHVASVGNHNDHSHHAAIPREAAQQGEGVHSSKQEYIQAILQRRQGDVLDRKQQATRNFRDRLIREAEVAQSLSAVAP